MMRAPENEATGTSGETEVLAEFERMGWAGYIDGRHDTGTDLYLRPRDPRRYELGVMVGAQVKTGSSCFGSEERDTDGDLVGWWHREPDQEHFDFWCSHALPHLLILRDQKTGTSYWVHVTRDAVVSTGKGAKILVHRSHVVGPDQRDALMRAALTRLPTPTWHGTAWTGAADLSPGEKLRYALMAPRLVAPHPNLGGRELDGAQALAMLVLMRHEVDLLMRSGDSSSLEQMLGERWSGLNREQAAAAGDFAWRACAALHDSMTRGEHGALLGLQRSATTASERAAAAVIAAAHYFRLNRPDSALVVIDSALDGDGYDPCDHAWLSTQRARALLELGSRQEALDEAVAAQSISGQLPHDVTAAAVAAACAGLAFSAAGWLGGDIADAITHGDTATSWWRAQLMSSGLGAHLDAHFQTWAEASPTRHSGGDPAERRLLSASMIANLAGDHDGFRRAQAALGKHLLTETAGRADPSAAADALTKLQRAGAGRDVRAAAKKLVDDGPMAAAQLATRRVALDASTRTSASADIELLTAAADVLTEDQADAASDWAIKTLEDPGCYLRLTGGTLSIPHKLLPLLRAIAPALSPEGLDNLRDWLVHLPAEQDDGAAQDLARVVHGIDADSWTAQQRTVAAQRTGDAAYLREAFMAVAASDDEGTREEILRRSREGELRVFEAINDVRDLPADGVSALLARLSEAIASERQSAADGISHHGGLDLGQAISVLNVWHPEQAQWEPLLDLLTDPNLRDSSRVLAIRVLAARGESIPPQAREQLRRVIDGLAEAERVSPHFQDADLTPWATEAQIVLAGPDERPPLVTAAVAGDSSRRAAAARALSRCGAAHHLETLIGLAADSDPAVSSSALTALAIRRGTAEGLSDVIDAVLMTAVAGAGALAAMAVVSAHDFVKLDDELIAKALVSPSARVRSAARKALRDR